MATAGPIRFSVVVPAFNEAAYLDRTLASLRRQDFDGGVEIIVVDNNSTDATAAIAAAHGVRVLYEARAGVCWARQLGSAAARGEIVVSTDADTTHPVNWLSRIDAVLRADPELVAVGGPCRFWQAPRWATAYQRLLFGAVQAVQATSQRVLYVTATNVAFRRTAFTGYDTACTQGGDELDLLRRLRRQGRVAFDPSNVVSTSSRRLRQGLLHTLFVSLLFQYVFAYYLNRLTSRTLVPTAPAIRSEGHRRRPSRLLVGVVGLTVAVALGLWPGDATLDALGVLHRLVEIR